MKLVDKLKAEKDVANLLEELKKEVKKIGKIKIAIKKFESNR